MLAYSHSDVGFSVDRHIREGSNRMLLQDAIEVLVVLEGELGLEVLAMIDPRLDVFGGLDDFVQFAKSKADVASYSDVGHFVFVQFRRVNIDVDNFRIFGK